MILTIVHVTASLAMMNRKRVRNAPENQADAVFKESLAVSAAVPRTHYSSSSGAVELWSPESKARRACLLAEMKASWSEKSERALSAIADEFCLPN